MRQGPSDSVPAGDIVCGWVLFGLRFSSTKFVGVGTWGHQVLRPYNKGPPVIIRRGVIIRGLVGGLGNRRCSERAVVSQPQQARSKRPTRALFF